MSHSNFIHRCLELAEHGRGRTGINPLVGSVLVRDEKIIGEGWHAAFGEDHAERALFKNFDQEIAQGDVLYVNLEPCSHYGKTPPCTELIIEKGIKTLVYGMQDPNPEVTGKGIQVLRDAGVQVIGPINSVQCRRLNRGFVSLHEQGRPWITLKRAQSKDGRTANDDLPAEALRAGHSLGEGWAKAGGSPLKITSEKQDAWSHEWLRAKHDAILVGVETIVRDDPQLTVRLPADRSAKREGSNKKVEQVKPLRIVLDPKCRVPLDARIICEGTIVVVGEEVRKSGGQEVRKLEEIKEKSVMVMHVPYDGKQFDFAVLWKILTTPNDNFHGITSILVEGGARTWETFKNADMVDEEVVLIG